MSRPPRISASSRRLAGSRMDDGSSRTRISGSMASTVATATRRRCPNDRWCGGRSAWPSMPTAARAPLTRVSSSGPRRPRLAGPKATSSATVGMNSWSSGSWKAIPTRRRISLRCSAATGRPATATRPAPGEHAVELQHQGGLAGPVGPSGATRSPRSIRLTPYSACCRPGRRRRRPRPSQGRGELTGGPPRRRPPPGRRRPRTARAASHWPRVAARS